ncbi:uncharacterized protein LOC119468619 [Cebus imitator]|uniref:uncharacterized protein LOC119468619 n=1 Tax=Cebus imitator TaxID=2715852 RepID=UPI00189BA8CD|nr:uncharacterized protein LOC119468619 [Cebus imitator]
MQQRRAPQLPLRHRQRNSHSAENPGTTLAFETDQLLQSQCGLHFSWGWRETAVVEAAERELRPGTPALSAAPQGSTVPGRHRLQPGRFLQRPLSAGTICCAPGPAGRSGAAALSTTSVLRPPVT